VTDAHEAIELTLNELARLRTTLAKGKSRQVSSAAELDVIKANVQTWLRTRRPFLLGFIEAQSLQPADAVFTQLMTAANRQTSRTRYLDLLKGLRKSLLTLQAGNAVGLASVPKTPAATSDAPPSFAPIASDPEMQKLLVNRWNECVACVGYGLPLAATVMLGGLLEALLVARINALPDQSAVFTAKAAPRDKAGKTLKLSGWMLNDYIDVAHELNWISATHKDVGAVLRDYRNYIHPYKEYQHKKTITPDDAKMLWEIGKTIMRQLLKP